MSRDSLSPNELNSALAADRARFLECTDVSRETLAALDAYAALLVKWQAAINLVGPATLGTLWTRHFLDSLQVASCLAGAKTVVDLGSGAGFPGCILALAVKEATPDGLVHLVESNNKKAAFLNTVRQALQLPANVFSDRLEVAVANLDRPDIVTARALASLTDLIRWTEPWLSAGTVALFHKGRDVDKELEDAARYWDIGYSVIPSVVDSASVVLRISSITRK